MKRIKLDLYESPTPLENTKDLWVDIDEDTNDIKAIHRYNHDKGEWEPYMVSVEYIKPDGNEATMTIIPSNTGVRVTNITDTEDGLMSYQLIQVVLPNSPFYGEINGATQTRVHAIAEGIFIGNEHIEYENIPLMDVLVAFYGDRNGFPFDPEHYRGCKIRIVASEDDLEIDSNTVVKDGCIPSVKFTKYTIKNENYGM